MTARRGGAPATVRYVLPTRTGKVVATCRASRDAGAELLPLCERAASTLRLSSVRNVPLATIVQEEGARWRLAAGRLRADRAAGLRRLEQARRRAEQALAAGALARVHERAERRFAPLVGGDAAVRAARATAAAYRQLGFAAQRGDSGAWNAARADVRRSESALAKAVRAN